MVAMCPNCPGPWLGISDHPSGSFQSIGFTCGRGGGSFGALVNADGVFGITPYEASAAYGETYDEQMAEVGWHRHTLIESWRACLSYGPASGQIQTARARSPRSKNHQPRDGLAPGIRGKSHLLYAQTRQQLFPIPTRFAHDLREEAAGTLAVEEVDAL